MIMAMTTTIRLSVLFMSFHSFPILFALPMLHLIEDITHAPLAN